MYGNRGLQRAYSQIHSGGKRWKPGAADEEELWPARG